jgi:GMP synthase (glutamine-hydrolysing)
MTAHRIHWVQHVPFEGLGAIEPWARHHGHALSCTRVHAGEALPAVDAFDWLVVMGGPMGVYEADQYPHITAEIELIEAAIGAGRRVLGICLGAQLIAAALGARVYAAGRREIGWFPVEAVADSTSPFAADLPAPQTLFHWHGDTFDLPTGALHIARSAQFEQQAFSYGTRVLAVQCHPEMDAPGVAALADAFGARLRPRPGVQSADLMRAQQAHFGPAQRLLDAWLDRLATA